jgi:hypothetical protein
MTAVKPGDQRQKRLDQLLASAAVARTGRHQSGVAQGRPGAGTGGVTR